MSASEETGRFITAQPTERGSMTRSKPERREGVAVSERVVRASLLRVIDPRSASGATRGLPS